MACKEVFSESKSHSSPGMLMWGQWASSAHQQSEIGHDFIVSVPLGSLRGHGHFLHHIFKLLRSLDGIELLKAYSRGQLPTCGSIASCSGHSHTQSVCRRE